MNRNCHKKVLIKVTQLMNHALFTSPMNQILKEKALIVCKTEGFERHSTKLFALKLVQFPSSKGDNNDLSR